MFTLSGNKQNNRNENDFENSNNIFDIQMDKNDDCNENNDLMDCQNMHQHINNNNANKSSLCALLFVFAVYDCLFKGNMFKSSNSSMKYISRHNIAILNRN